MQQQVIKTMEREMHLIDQAALLWSYLTALNGEDTIRPMQDRTNVPLP